MRKVKFRVYHTESETMTYMNDWEQLQSCQPSMYEENPVMQYTGLRDKNGIEIYEGDIIRAYADTDINGKDLYYYGEVKYLEGAFNIRFTAGGEEYLCDYAAQIEVIGNIFDNPELLEVKQ